MPIVNQPATVESGYRQLYGGLYRTQSGTASVVMQFELDMGGNVGVQTLQVKSQAFSIDTHVSNIVSSLAVNQDGSTSETWGQTLLYYGDPITPIGIHCQVSISAVAGQKDVDIPFVGRVDVLNTTTGVYLHKDLITPITSLILPAGNSYILNMHLRI